MENTVTTGEKAMKTTDGLEHLNALRPLLAEALRPLLADALTWHSTEHTGDGQTLQVLFMDEAGRTWACTVPLDGSPATLCRVD